MQLILASNSPRRKEILTNAGFSFKVISSDYEEQAFCSDPYKTATTFAFNKANSVFNSLEEKGGVAVLGSDTVVYFNGKILGKPKNEIEAFEMLKALSNKKHVVITGFAIITKEKTIIDFDESQVYFSDLTDEQIKAYIKSGLYKGKAGSYGIQDSEYNLVKEHRGSLTNIIGLPIEKVQNHLSQILSK